MSVPTHFRAMGSPAEVWITGADRGLGDLARRTVEHLEQRWSRFLPTSDLTRMNLANGDAVRVHPDTITLVVAMVEGWTATDRAFDPTMLAAMVRIGYAASRLDPARMTSLPPGPTGLSGMADIDIDRAGSTIQLPRGTALDPGAIGKGLAADLTVAVLLDSGARGALVNLGGDVSVAGDPGDGDAWQIAIADPDDDNGEIGRVALTQGGVATSGITRHRLVDQQGRAHHHLLDPFTGRAPDHSLVQATVVAGTAAWAEVLATQVMVAGPDAVQGLDAAASAVDANGRIVTNQRWSIYAMETGARR